MTGGLGYYDKKTRRDRLCSKEYKRRQGFAWNRFCWYAKDTWQQEHGGSGLPRGEVVWFTLDGVVHKGVVVRRHLGIAEVCCRVKSANPRFHGESRLRNVDVEEVRLCRTKEACADLALKASLAK